MMNSARRRVLGLIAISAVFSFGVMGAQGCGSDSFTTAPSTDASATTDAGPQDSGSEAADACVKPPAVSPDEQPFCDAYAEISSRCNQCKQCWQDNANACQQFGASISAPLRNAIVACKDTIQCDDFDTEKELIDEPCVAAWITDAGLSAPQMAANQAYCDNCADSGPTGASYCTNYFYSPDGGSSIGSLVLIVSDSVASDIAKNCKTCDVASYPFLCALPTFCKAAGKDECGEGLCQ